MRDIVSCHKTTATKNIWRIELQEKEIFSDSCLQGSSLQNSWIVLDAYIIADFMQVRFITVKLVLTNIWYDLMLIPNPQEPLKALNVVAESG